MPLAFGALSCVFMTFVSANQSTVFRRIWTNESAPLCSKGLGRVPLCPDTARARVSTAVTNSIRFQIKHKNAKLSERLFAKFSFPLFLSKKTNLFNKSESQRKKLPLVTL